MADLDMTEDLGAGTGYRWGTGYMKNVPSMGVSEDVTISGTVAMGGMEFGGTGDERISAQDVADGMAAFLRVILDRHPGIEPGSPPDDGGFVIKMSRSQQTTTTYAASEPVQRDEEPGT